jgi:hypothetical protein
MGEKRGSTVKLKYDFPTEGVLEVGIKGNWYRTTAKEFRSFDGPRRITKPVKQPGLGDSMFDVPMETISYEGPVYMYETNNEVLTCNEEKIVTSPYWDNKKEISKKRG